MSDFYSTGTVSVAGGATVVTGAGTLWLTAGVLSGDSIILDGRYATIASVDSNTQVTLASAWTGANQTGASYTIRFDAPSRIKNVTLLAQVRELIAQAGIIRAARPNYEVQSLGTNAPPGAPVTGDLYVVGTAPTGAWAGQANNLAQWTGSAWLITAPQRGTTVVSAANSKTHIWSGSAWGVYVPPSPFIETLMGDTSGDAVCTTIGAARLNQFTSGTPTSSTAWYRFPDNTILQRGWSVVTTDASGVASIILPTSFSGGLTYQFIPVNGDYDSLGYEVGVLSNEYWPKAGATLVFVRSTSTGSPVASTMVRVDWLAMGR